MRILIAEDDLVSREFLSRLLDKYGDCDVAVNGIEAVDAFIMALDEQKPYDLILIDIMMPLYDGVKVLKAIRNIEKQRKIDKADRIKAAITSALYDESQVLELRSYGIDAYFTKPIDLSEFRAFIEGVE
ncbi:MAG: response regulator [Clostridia bacterium]|nr:response regulator [Clostridia bacterium]